MTTLSERYGLITAQPLRTVDITAPITLFDVAAQELDDASQWNRIAELNGLTDPFVTSSMTLAIPPRNDLLANGGIHYATGQPEATP